MNTEWMQRAACAGHPNPDLFFPTATAGDSASTKQVADAARVCRTCPVTRECEQYRRDTHSEYGVWGGVTHNTRPRHLTLEEDDEIQDAVARGESVSALARRLGRNRKTINKWIKRSVLPHSSSEPY